NLRHEGGGINNYARPDYCVSVGPQNPAGNELQHEPVFPNDDRVSGVVASGNARDVIKRAGQIVDDLAFPLITPLRAHHYNGFHPVPFSSHSSGRPGPTTVNRGRTLPPP